MSEAAIVVRRIGLDDVDVYRDIRLQALQDAPSAFASTYDKEAAQPADAWADRVSRSAAGIDRTTFLAFDGDVCVGLAGAGPDDLGADLQLVSMWVAPSHRGSVVATKLVEAVFAWAGDVGAARIALWVTRGNDRARRMYERMGFVVTGDVQPLPSDPCKEEIRMIREDVRRLIERRLAELDGLLPGESMFGHGAAYWVNGKEVLHFEEGSTVEIRLTRAVIRDHRAALKADDRVVLRPHGGDWITVRYATTTDVDFVVRLTADAAAAHRPAPGVPAKPPPTGADLARRQRFH